METSPSSVKREFRSARAWLFRELGLGMTPERWRRGPGPLRRGRRSPPAERAAVSSSARRARRGARATRSSGCSRPTPSAGDFLETPAVEHVDLAAPSAGGAARLADRPVCDRARARPRRDGDGLSRGASGPRRLPRRPWRSSSCGAAWTPTSSSRGSAPSGRSSRGSTIPTSRGSSTAARPRTACRTSSWSTSRAGTSSRTADARGLGVRERLEAVPAGLRRGRVRAPAPRRPPRPEAVEHPRDAGRRAEAARLRPREGAAARARTPGPGTGPRRRFGS